MLKLTLEQQILKYFNDGYDVIQISKILERKESYLRRVLIRNEVTIK